jgi:hypothetical protein
MKEHGVAAVTLVMGQIVVFWQGFTKKWKDPAFSPSPSAPWCADLALYGQGSALAQMTCHCSSPLTSMLQPFDFFWVSRTCSSCINF